MKKTLLSIALLIFLLKISAQQPLKAHSHNDYSNIMPFWIAYYNHFSSIEADIWLVNNELYVAHGKNDIKPERTLDALYIQPVVKMVRYNGGKPWFDYPSGLQLLIDLKTEGVATLDLLADKLKEYPDVFDPGINRDAVRIVISGNRPDPSLYGKYPSFIFFDGVIGQKYGSDQLGRVPLFSENLKSIIRWDGITKISDNDRKKLIFIVDSIHAMNKKVRFWNAPDNPAAWEILLNAGVDYVNTDHINQLATFLKNK